MRPHPCRHMCRQAGPRTRGPEMRRMRRIWDGSHATRRGAAHAPPHGSATCADPNTPRRLARGDRDPGPLDALDAASARKREVNEKYSSGPV